ncbi:MAG: S8 family serine peptidase [Aminobacterium sp.]
MFKRLWTYFLFCIFLPLFLLFFYVSFVEASTADDFKTWEYWNSTGLDAIHAADAYALGFTGKGITLALADTGVLFSHPEFFGKNPHLEYPISMDPWDWNKNDHGTHVAGIMAANKDNIGMHGLAFDAGVVSLRTSFSDNELGYLYPKTYLIEDAKIINNSWGTFSEFYLDDVKTEEDRINNINKYISMNPLSSDYFRKMVLDYDKVLVFAAGNDGHLGPCYEGGLAYYFPELAGNTLSVVAFDPSKNTSDPAFVANFSNLAQKVEENSIAAPGVDINSAYSGGTGSGYINMSGTSMAAPYVSATLGLVQQAFPYMNGKQLVDVVLSTANNHFDLPRYTLSLVTKYDENYRPFIGGANLLYLENVRPSPDQIEQDLRDYYQAADFLKRYFLTADDWLAWVEPHMNIYDNVQREAVFGQGLLDVGKAVRGPGLFNARRLSSHDINIQYGIAQALYSIDTHGYYSVWSNDIGEKRAITGTLAGLPVGLNKTGRGTLVLTGDNSYMGVSVVSEGELQIDGSVVANVYSEAEGTLSGSGVLESNMINHGTLRPGKMNQPGTLTIRGNLESDGAIEVVVDALENGHLVVNGSADIDGTTVRPLSQSALRPNSRYQFLRASSGISGVFAPNLFSAFLEAEAVHDTHEAVVFINKIASLDSLAHLTPIQNDTASRLEEMFITFEGSSTQRQLDPLYNLSDKQARRAYEEIYGGAQACLITMTPLNEVLGQTSFSSRRINSSWWGELSNGRKKLDSDSRLGLGELRTKTFNVVVGRDNEVNQYWHVGKMLAYGEGSVDGLFTSGDEEDWRLGLYGSYQKDSLHLQTYIAGGMQKYDLCRNISSLGLEALSNYDSKNVEFGIHSRWSSSKGECEDWYVHPFFSFVLSKYWQDGYEESGAGIYSQKVKSLTNTYSTGTIGLEFAKRTNDSYCQFIAGYKRVLSGENPDLLVAFAGAPSDYFTVKGNEQSRDWLLLSLKGEKQFADDWMIEGKIETEFSNRGNQRKISLKMAHFW